MRVRNAIVMLVALASGYFAWAGADLAAAGPAGFISQPHNSDPDLSPVKIDLRECNSTPVGYSQENDGDRKRLAEEAIAEAKLLEAKGDADSLRKALESF